MNTLEQMNSVLIKQKEYFVKNGAPSIEFKDINKNKLLNNTPFKHF